MDVLFLLLWLAVGAACIAAALYVLVIAGLATAGVGLLLYCYWPIPTGLVLGVLTWRSGHDNFGAILMIAGVVGQYFWSKKRVKFVNEHGG